MNTTLFCENKWTPWRSVLVGIIGCVLAASCVSVSLDKNEVVHAKNVKFKNPEAPFEEIDIPNSDKTWISVSFWKYDFVSF
jgi:hypothetical protein